MLHENIKTARQARGLSQEELALQLNVVRQTVSKWENSLSVPDADVLIKLAEVLDVSVIELLGVTPNETARDDTIEDLAQQLARLNEQLAAKKQEHDMYLQAGKKRGLILMLCFVAMWIALSVQNALVSIVLIGGCVLAALIILYRNLALLTHVTTPNAKLGTIRLATIFNIGIVLLLVIVVALNEAAVITLSQSDDRLLSMVLIGVLMLFVGYIGPKLPYNRHTGLRLPWTVQDEDTWNLAHRILGYISFPLVLLYLAAACTIQDFETVTLMIILIWIGIPGGMSLLFFWKKYHGRL